MVAAFFRLHNERAVRTAALRRVHVVQVHFVDGLQVKSSVIGRVNTQKKNTLMLTEKYAPPRGLRSDLSEK